MVAFSERGARGDSACARVMTLHADSRTHSNCQESGDVFGQSVETVPGRSFLDGLGGRRCERDAACDTVSEYVTVFRKSTKQ